jgi:Zinc-binding dehydrogenase
MKHFRVGGWRVSRQWISIELVSEISSRSGPDRNARLAEQFKASSQNHERTADLANGRHCPNVTSVSFPAADRGTMPTAVVWVTGWVRLVLCRRRPPCLRVRWLAVGQIAKIKGCRTIGFAGGREKVRQCIEDFGYDYAIDYKATKEIDEVLVEHCPEGIDAFFDNTSVAVHDAVLRRINLGARIAICGTASYASWDPWNEGPRPERHLLVKRAIMQGFLTTDFAARYEEGVAALAGWIREGRLQYREDVLDGIEAAPASIAMLYAGENRGKLIIRL